LDNKKIITNFKLYEFKEIILNKILDKINKSGFSSLTPEERELLKNDGENKKHFESGDIIFDIDNTVYFSDIIWINGTIKYHGNKFNGKFELSKEGGNDPISLLSYFDGFEPDDDDWYNLDDLIEELEYVYLN